MVQEPLRGGKQEGRLRFAKTSFCTRIPSTLESIPMNIPSFLAIGPLGGQEMFFIGALVLLLFGAKKLPEFARGLGKSMGEFKKARNEFEQEIHRATDEPQISRPAAAIAAPPVSAAPVVTVETPETKPVV